MLTYCPNSQLDIEYLCNRYWEDLFEDPSGLSIDFSQFEMTDERIDFQKSLEKLMKAQARLDFELIFDTRYDNVNVDQATETWSSLIYARYRAEMDRLVNLCRACVRNADTRIIQIAGERVNSAILQGSALLNIGPMFARFEDFVRSHIQSILASITTNRAGIDEFIVYRSSPQSSLSAASQSASHTASAIQEGTGTKATDEDDNQSIDSNQFDSVSSTLSGNSMDIDHHFSEAIRQKKEGYFIVFIIMNRKRIFKYYCD